MKIINDNINIDFLGKKKLALVFSMVLIIASFSSLIFKGLNFGIDFTGGMLVEVGYQDTASTDEVRTELQNEGFGDAQVQYFGSSKDILIRLPISENTAATVSIEIMEILRNSTNQKLFKGTVSSNNNGQITEQYCVNDGADTSLVSESEASICQVQMHRVEFVGPQVGQELAEKGGLAMIYALIAILIYVSFRFEWRFSVGAVIALVHDVIITLGVFSLFQFEFNLPVVAAILAVIGYSLNDTIVVFDRVRENFRRIHKGAADSIINTSINHTLPRTILTSFTTILVLLALLLLGGEVIRSFAIALFVGVLIGTYSSIFIASPMVLMLGVEREHLLPTDVEKEGADQDALI